MSGTSTAVRMPPRDASGAQDVAHRELDRFAEAIDARTMGPRLASALGAGSSTCHVLDAKYQPGVGASVLYRLGEQLLRADLLPPVPSPGPGGTGPGLGTVVAPGLSVHAFPADPDMASLPLVMDPDHLGPALAAALGTSADRAGGMGSAGTGRRTGCRITLLRYRPGKRATVLVRLPDGQATYVAKVYHDAAKAAAVAAEAGALERTSRSAESLRFAPPAGHLPGLSLVVQRTVAGSPLTALLDTPNGPVGSAVAGVRRAAQALAELHEARPDTLRQRSVERELHRFTQRAQRIECVAPRQGDALSALAGRLLDVHGRLPAPELGTVHGDCKPSQFMLGPRHVYLLDVDHLGVSDLAGDVGTFLASLRQLAVRRGLSARRRTMPAAYDTLADAFLEAYLAARGGRPDVARIHWQEAVALERKALRAFARAPRSPLVTALTTEAHRRLDARGGSHGQG